MYTCWRRSIPSWDRRRFELFWGWPYRFEAYTPAAKRTLGYYALPLLWRDAVVGWANVTARGGRSTRTLAMSLRPPRERTFKRELDAEIERLRRFLQSGHRPDPAELTRARPGLQTGMLFREDLV